MSTSVSQAVTSLPNSPPPHTQTDTHTQLLLCRWQFCNQLERAQKYAIEQQKKGTTRGVHLAHKCQGTAHDI